MEMLLGLTATGCRENWSGEKCRRGSKYLASQVLITGHQACKVRRAINPSPVPQPLQQSIVLKTFTQHVNPYPNQNQKPNLNMNLNQLGRGWVYGAFISIAGSWDSGCHNKQ